ncbi:MAG: hypothetical protein IJ529_05635 [Alphaproteobacteria bacterium]|nr:hypothetical protein [Alphaproteobacteria bacterium]MBQ8677930.1 hypothetical protein [Alphaproteobacteria bacterium]
MVTLKEIRVALLEADVLTETELSAIPDEVLMSLSFSEHLFLDSLDYLVLIEKLDKYNLLPVSRNNLWECRTVQELLDQLNN